MPVLVGGQTPSAELLDRGNSKMLKRMLVLAALLGLTLGTTGCLTLNWHHNRRHVRKVVDQLQELHMDVDKIVFDLDRNPAE